MANSFKTSSMVWVIDSAGALITDAPKLNRVWIGQVVLFPSALADDLVLQDKNSETVVTLKAGASDASPVRIDFQGKGKPVTGLKCSTIDGTSTAHIYLN